MQLKYKIKNLYLLKLFIVKFTLNIYNSFNNYNTIITLTNKLIIISNNVVNSIIYLAISYQFNMFNTYFIF